MLSQDNTWQPSAQLAILRARANLLAKIRNFFAVAGVLEVETPTCSRYANTDPAIESLTTCFVGPGYFQGLPLYLHTSPEFSMKRLLAAGSGPIYQICRVYRNGESGGKHNPEFSLLEWYRPNFNYQQLMDEVTLLIETVADRPLSHKRLSYKQLFLDYLDVNPHNTNIQALRGLAIELGISGAMNLELSDQDAWLDLLITHSIEPQLPVDTMLFVYDYPASQASLAKIRPGSPPLAERFELYLGGMELANGFCELADAAEQERRFSANLTWRKTHGLTLVPMDTRLLSALKAGFPDCSGVALGLDRLLMWLNKCHHIDQVLAFPLARA